MSRGCQNCDSCDYGIFVIGGCSGPFDASTPLHSGEVEPVIHAAAPPEDAAEWVRIVPGQSVTDRVVPRP